MQLAVLPVVRSPSESASRRGPSPSVLHPRWPPRTAILHQHMLVGSPAIPAHLSSACMLLLVPRYYRGQQNADLPLRANTGVPSTRRVVKRHQSAPHMCMSARPIVTWTTRCCRPPMVHRRRYDPPTCYRVPVATLGAPSISTRPWALHQPVTAARTAARGPTHRANRLYFLVYLPLHLFLCHLAE